MNELDKIKVMLPHWIGHNQGHGEEFKKWATNLQSAGETEISALLMKAAAALTEAQRHLEQALAKAGGSLEKSSHHPGCHHHHDHHH